MLDDAPRSGRDSPRRGFAVGVIAAAVPDCDAQRQAAGARTFDPTNPTRWLS